MRLIVIFVYEPPRWFKNLDILKSQWRAQRKMKEKIKFTDASVRDAFSPSYKAVCLSNEDERLWRRPTVKGRCRPGPSRCAIDNKGQAQPLL